MSLARPLRSATLTGDIRRFLVGGLVVLMLAQHAVSRAELDNQVFTSRTHRIKLTVPKGWRPSELPSYPGVLLWMLRSQPPGWIIVGSEPLRQQLVCSWPVACRTLSQPLAARYACALRAQLERQNVLIGPVQAGPKENLAAGLPSVWFEFTDGKRFVRQALAVNERRAITIALSTFSAADRATHARAFDQALRSLRELSEGEVHPAAANPIDEVAAPATDGSSGADLPTDGAAERTPATASPTVPPPIAAPMFDPERPCP